MRVYGYSKELSHLVPTKYVFVEIRKEILKYALLTGGVLLKCIVNPVQWSSLNWVHICNIGYVKLDWRTKGLMLFIDSQCNTIVRTCSLFAAITNLFVLKVLRTFKKLF